MSYTQLTCEQRYQIYALMKSRHDQTRIAEIVGYHKSTVSRELVRNRGRRSYRPKQAHELSRARHLAAYYPRVTSATWELVESLLRRE